MQVASVGERGEAMLEYYYLNREKLDIMLNVLDEKLSREPDNAVLLTQANHAMQQVTSFIAQLAALRGEPPSEEMEVLTSEFTIEYIKK